MKSIIRQVFGTTRPKEIWGDLLTFDRLVTKPVVHIVYWCGLGLLFVAAMAVLGVSIGNALSDLTVKGVLLSIPMLIIGWLGVLIGVLVWRSFCELYMAVMSIAEDLRFLRQYQERLSPAPAPVAEPAPAPAPAPVVREAFVPEPQAAAEPAPMPQAEPAEPGQTEPGHDVLEDPFFNPRFGKRDY